MPLRGGSNLRQIRVSPAGPAPGVIDLGRLFGSTKGLDPSSQTDVDQIKAVAQGYASGAFDDEQIAAFIEENPGSQVYLEPVISQVKNRKDVYGRSFESGNIQEGAVRAAGEFLRKGDATSAAEAAQFGPKTSESPFGKVDPKDYTPESIRTFSQTRDPSVLVPRDKPIEPGTTFNQEEKLRGEYRNLSKDFIQVRDSFGRIQESAKEPSGAGDLALIFNYMKMLDPGSTVREGEFASAQNSAGVPSRVQALYNRALNGERLDDKTRTDFVGRSKSLYQRQLTTQKKLERQYRGLASKYKVDGNRIVTDFDLEEMPAEAKAPTQTGWKIRKVK